MRQGKARQVQARTPGGQDKARPDQTKLVLSSALSCLVLARQMKRTRLEALMSDRRNTQRSNLDIPFKLDYGEEGGRGGGGEVISCLCLVGLVWSCVLVILSVLALMLVLVLVQGKVNTRQRQNKDNTNTSTSTNTNTRRKQDKDRTNETSAKTQRPKARQDQHQDPRPMT